MQKLEELYANIDIEEDPYITKCRADPSMNNSKQLKKALEKRKTYCLDQIRSLYTKATAIFIELGSWATEYYICTTVDNFCFKANIDGISMVDTLDDAEQMYLKKVLRVIKPCDNNPRGLDWLFDGHATQADHKFGSHACLSAKVKCLVDYLADTEMEDLTGLVFVQTRAACAILAHILAIHPKTKDKLRISTFVGMSSSPKRKFDMGELVDVKNQTDTLDHLRHGHKNLVIATSVLEEGIDVSACNVVICFEKPPNLKAFIQRRGRARKSRSKYVLMFSNNDSGRWLRTVPFLVILYILGARSPCSMFIWVWKCSLQYLL